MFNIVKILNSGASTPDVLRLPIGKDVATKPGCALVIKDGALACPGENEIPQFVVIDRTSEESVTAYTVGEGVVFKMKPTLETEIDEDGVAHTEAAPMLLERVGIAQDNGIAVGIKKNNEGSGIVIGTDGDYLLVIFR